MNLDALARTLVTVVDKKVGAGQLELPVLPWHKPALLGLLQGRFALEAVLPILERDPILALECLRQVQRSARPRPVDHAGALLHAVGTTNMRQLVATLSRRRYYESRDTDVREIFWRVCAHSVVVSVVSRQVAVHAGLPEPDQAAFGGLIVSAGGPIVAFHLLDLERAAGRSRGMAGLNAAAFLALVQRTSADVGRAAIAHFRLPGFVGSVLDDPDEYDTSQRRSVANCIRFGRQVAIRAGVGLGEGERDRVLAALMIGRSVLELRDDAVGYLVEAAEEVAEQLPEG